ncbi:MAG: sodium ion-translocating decarboxylase subunit beta, partial [Chloroflexota bacterium]|nr:sodium ion-translocating decarboxylase subunit beta [Chloroflexota bacterium]
MFGLYEMAFAGLTWGNILMFFLAGVLIYLGIVKKMEPLLLVPMGFGMLMVNVPFAGLMFHAPASSAGAVPMPVEVHGNISELMSAVASGKIGLLNILYQFGLQTEIIPMLMFFCIGAMTDFTPCISRPIYLVFGAATQIGIFVVLILSLLTGHFSLPEAASIGIIGGATGPVAVYFAVARAPQLLGPIALVAYSYMALVPILQPPVIRAMTTKKQRQIYMKPAFRKVSNLEKILFPISIFLVTALFVPKAAPLVGMLMGGNLLYVCGVTERLAQSASTVFIDILTILLTVTVGALMPAVVFLNTSTLLIVVLAAIAFAICTAGGIGAVHLVNLFLKEKINPLIGAAGVSAIPMAARVAQVEGQKANPRNFLLM